MLQNMRGIKILADPLFHKILEYLFVFERKSQKLVFSGAEAASLAKTFTKYLKMSLF